MLSAHAYSFRQKSRLAISLSWIAGFTNVITLIVSAQTISHVTGNTTWMGRMLVGPWDGEVGHTVFVFGFLVGTFFLGAVLSGLMTERADRQGLSSRYIAPIASEAILLGLYSICLVYWAHGHGHVMRSGGAIPLPPPIWMVGLASVAMGLQNATITKVSGDVVRTTHVTGVVTDLGLQGVQLFMWWRDKTRCGQPGRYGRVLRVSRRYPTAMRVLLLASIYGSFLFGVCAGSVLYFLIPDQAMLAPLLFLVWIVLVDYTKPIAYVMELDFLEDPELRMFGIVKSLLPAGLGIYRLAHSRKNAIHHAPNFQMWVNRLPAHWRVIILSVSHLTRFDGESVADLRTAAQRLEASGRRLIVSGINPTQYRLMDAMGLTDVLDKNNFSPDLEFAIAWGIELVRELGAVERE